MLVGIAAMIVGIWHVADCARYQTRQGQCNAVIEANALPVVTGMAAILAGWGGFNTVNPALSRSSTRRRDPKTGRFLAGEKVDG